MLSVGMKGLESLVQIFLCHEIKTLLSAIFDIENEDNKYSRRVGHCYLSCSQSLGYHHCNISPALCFQLSKSRLTISLSVITMVIKEPVAAGLQTETLYSPGRSVHPFASPLHQHIPFLSRSLY
jgi:hypothetical protein